jgi:hypothetical protein
VYRGVPFVIIRQEFTTLFEQRKGFVNFVCTGKNGVHFVMSRDYSPSQASRGMMEALEFFNVLTRWL